MKYDNEETINHLGVFPSANVIYKLHENSNVRLSYYRATARPSFKETSISQIYDPLSDLIYNGNIDLKPSMINNYYDIRYELYNKKDNLVGLSGFYKTFKDPIELTFFNAAAPNDIKHRNIRFAQVYGIELELRQGLDLISESLNKFDVNINFSYMASKQEMDRTKDGEYDSKLNLAREGEKVQDTRPQQGESPYLINAVLSYNKDWPSNLCIICKVKL